MAKEILRSLYSKWALTCLGVGILSAALSAYVVSQSYKQKIESLERYNDLLRYYEARSKDFERHLRDLQYATSDEKMNRQREFSRLLMHAVEEDRLKLLPQDALRSWLAVADVTKEQNGWHRYEWTNYTSTIDGPNIREGAISGKAWLLIDDTGHIQDLGYVSE